MKKKTGTLIGLGCMMVAMLSFYACGKKTEAVIVTEEEMTEATKQNETLSESKQDRFSYKDLMVDKVKYLMTEQEVIDVMGQPVSIIDSTEKKSSEGVLAEIVYSYNDLTLIFSKIDDAYLLTAAASLSDQDTFARGIKVGDHVDQILNQYYRDQNCMNHYWYSDDKTAVLGKFLYGDFTMEQLDAVKTKDAISYGLINYNGYNSMETAESYIVEFTYFEPPYTNDYAQISDKFCQLAFDIDNDGVITSIRWYYYPEDNK